MNSAAPTGLFTGRHMLVIMVAFFGVIFAANFTMVYFALSSWTGLVVKNSYVASQAFDKTTAQLEKAALGVNAAIHYVDGTLTVMLTDTAGRVVSASRMTAQLGRPSHEGEDREIALLPQPDGKYSAKFPLGQGQWAGQITADIAGHEGWQRPLRILVRN